MAHESSHGGSNGTLQQSSFDNTGKLAAILIGVAAGVVGFLMYLFNPFLRGAASVEGALIDHLFSITLGIGTAVFVIVQGLLLYSIIRFSRQPGDETDGPPIRGNHRLEIIWTVVPALTVIFLSLLSYRVLALIELERPEEMVVEVTGIYPIWQFYYPEYDVTTAEMHLPVNRTVLLKMHSKDVIHSFWVPAFRIKKDVMPDRETRARITPTETGTYPIVCAELCGAAHSQMTSQVVVESDGAFEQWVASQGALAESAAAAVEANPIAEGDPIAEGRSVFIANGCGGCHTLDDAGAAGQVGPSLNAIAARAGNTVSGESAEEYLRYAIVNPNAHIVENYAANVMPSTYGKTIPADDLDALVAYMLAQQ